MEQEWLADKSTIEDGKMKYMMGMWLADKRTLEDGKTDTRNIHAMNMVGMA